MKEGNLALNPNEFQLGRFIVEITSKQKESFYSLWGLLEL